MTGAANFIIPRIIKEIEPKGAFLAAAIIHDNSMADAESVMYQEDSLFIVADASIYNKLELSEKLRINFSPDEKIDAKLILKSFIKWNKACVKYLYGDFAFVIFNCNTGEIFSARDHFGIRPLFYLYHHELFFFSSELRLIKAVKKLQERPEYLLETLITAKTEKNLTSFHNVFRLPPAHFLILSQSDIEIQKYWDLNPGIELTFSTAQEHYEYIRKRLINAVRLRTSGTDKLGTELSGGLDSSSITGIAADICRVSGQNLKAFSNLFPDHTGIEFKDEREYINNMREHKVFGWHGVEGLKHSIPDLLRYTLNVQGCPVQQNFSIFNRSLYEAVANDNIRVLFSGFGGDELVSAPISFPWNELIRKRQWKNLAYELFGQGISLRSIIKFVTISGRYLKSRLSKPSNSTPAYNSYLIEQKFAYLPLQSDFVLKNSLRDQFIKIYRKQRPSSISLLQYARIMKNHVTQRIEYCYTAAAQYGIEYRYPLLDIDLVQAALSMPAWLKQRHGINRNLFRSSIYGIVPEKIRLRNEKLGSPIPHKYYQLVKDHEEILNLIKSASSSSFLKEIFDFKKLILLYERIVCRDPADRKYLLPGVFYSYLMIILYYLDNQENDD